MPEKSSTRQRLLLALAKLKRNEGDGKRLSISAVAREAGVSHTLIHTKYPDIADKIREASGRSPRQQLFKHREQLKVTEDRSAELRNELADVRRLNRGLASENARLTLLVIKLEKEVAALEAGVHPLRTRRKDAVNPSGNL